MHSQGTVAFTTLNQVPGDLLRLIYSADMVTIVTQEQVPLKQIRTMDIQMVEKEKIDKKDQGHLMECIKKKKNLCK